MANAGRAGPPIRAVGELVLLARERLEGAFPDVLVEGEVSNAKLAPSGHAYFTLKDERAQLRAVMWKNRAAALRFRLEDGQHLLARGTLTVYEARGDMQLQVLSLEPLGTGALMLAFEQLRLRLEAEGLFAQPRKRPIPLLPRRIGIVTSPSGAAIRDILQVLGRRHAALAVLIAPVRVQGEGSAGEIAAAIERLNRFPDIDVLIVGRGGGSIEDLWAFNEEIVARAIAASRVPVIAAVGHETDFTIADFVADLRAPTPSAAAELVCAARAEMAERIAALARRMVSALRLQIERRRARLERLRRARALGQVENLPRSAAQQVDELSERLRRAVELRLERLEERLARAASRLPALDVRVRVASRRAHLRALQEALRAQGRHALVRRRESLAVCAARLSSLSPLAVLGRGYALARLDGPQGPLLLSARAAEVGRPVHLTLAEGGLLCRVEERKP